MPSSPRRLRVVINGIHAKSGGGVTYLNQLLPELAACDDLELHLILHESQFPLLRLAVDNVRVHLFRFPNSFARLMLWEQVVLPVMFRLMGGDVLFSPANYGPLLVSRQVLLLRNSLAVFGVAQRLGQRAYWIALAAMTALCVMRARASIAVSRYALDSLTRGLPAFVQRKARVIYHGVSERFRHAAPAPAETHAAPYLLAVSDIYVQKNLLVLVEAMAQLPPRHSALMLKIAGRKLDAEYSAQVESRVRALGLERRVEFLGSVSPDLLPQLYAGCTVFVFPSVVETFGNPLVEAMASGCAIISSDATAMPEVLGEAGLTFSPRDTQALAQQISRFLDDPALRAEYSQRARLRAELFSWRKTAMETAEALRHAARPLPLPRQRMD